ncbi:MAG TPA: hypothetical protein VFT17_03310 [Propionibacteriaceae bacterium]|nr:hypothetical protein [Propionibacteriaceae bacterium]
MPSRKAEIIETSQSAQSTMVCGTWQNSELGGRKPGAVAIDAATNQSEDLHRVLWLHDVGIANDDQCWSGDRLEVSGPPALELAVELVAFADQSRPVPRIWEVEQALAAPAIDEQGVAEELVAKRQRRASSWSARTGCSPH